MRIPQVAALLVALTCASAVAQAQYTAAVVPPPKPKTIDTVARKDSLAKANVQLAERMTNMKAWVDSAAQTLAVNAPPDTGTALAVHRDSVTVVASGEVTGPPAVAESTTTTKHFRNGAPAPATATPLPLLALLGASSLVLGIALRRRTG